MSENGKKTILNPTECAAASRRCYDKLAREYYNAKLHPSSAVFRELSIVALNRHNHFLRGKGKYVEFGCGLGVLDTLVQSDQVVLTDNSPQMLQHAIDRTSDSVSCLQTDALRSCFEKNSVSVAVALLADPYNVPEFFNEMNRVVRLGGALIFSTPSHEWAVALREKVGLDETETRFTTQESGIISAPSFVRSRQKQESVLREAGFSIVAFEQLAVQDSNCNPSPHVQLAAKKLNVSDRILPIVDFYVTKKLDIEC